MKRFLHQNVVNIVNLKLNAFAKIYVRLYVIIYHIQAYLSPVARCLYTDLFLWETCFTTCKNIVLKTKMKH